MALGHTTAVKVKNLILSCNEALTGKINNIKIFKEKWDRLEVSTSITNLNSVYWSSDQKKIEQTGIGTTRKLEENWETWEEEGKGREE